MSESPRHPLGAQSPAPPSGASFDVLVVEDDAATLEVLLSALRRTGLSVDGAASGPLALELMRTGRWPKVIVSDIRMPSMTGLAFIEQLFRDEDRPRPEIIFVSGHAGFDDAVAALRLGARDLLSKPIDIFRLLALVREAITPHPTPPSKPAAASAPPASEVRDIDPGVADATAKSVLATLRRERVLRARHLPAGLSAEPCWEMLLDLYDEARAGRTVSVTSLAGASGLPPTSALRRVRELEAAGLVRRAPDPSDRRRHPVVHRRLPGDQRGLTARPERRERVAMQADFPDRTAR
ncbi:MAG: DNA-binding response regulator [Reyranellaceae bacterium]